MKSTRLAIRHVQFVFIFVQIIDKWFDSIIDSGIRLYAKFQRNDRNKF